jgi:hypothetical protein
MEPSTTSKPSVGGTRSNNRSPKALIAILIEALGQGAIVVLMLHYGLVATTHVATW